MIDSPHGLQSYPKHDWLTYLGQDILDGVCPHTVVCGGVEYKTVSHPDSPDQPGYGLDGTVEQLMDDAQRDPAEWGIRSWGEGAAGERAMHSAVYADGKLLALVTGSSGPSCPPGVLLHRADVKHEDAKRLADDNEVLIDSIGTALGYC